MVRNRKSEHHHWIPHIQISLGTKFLLKLTFFFNFSSLKQKKWTQHIFYIILHIQISLVRSFGSNWEFWFFRPHLPKKVFLVKNWESEYRHWIMHIQSSLGTKFLLKLTILIFFRPDLSKKGFSGLKQKK